MRSEYYKCDSAHVMIFFGQFEVHLTAIHQGAAEFGYEMCILVSILLLIIMEHQSCVYEQVCSSFISPSCTLHMLVFMNECTV